jgi:translation initiation factor 1
MSPRSENPTVYSTETGRVCPACGRPLAQCVCKKKSAAPAAGDGIVRVRIESKGRGGKTVSLVTGLAMDEESLKKLAGELKRVCGAGGAVKDGIIEIQGDHRDALVEALKKQSIKAKRV